MQQNPYFSSDWMSVIYKGPFCACIFIPILLFFHIKSFAEAYKHSASCWEGRTTTGPPRACRFLYLLIFSLHNCPNRLAVFSVATKQTAPFPITRHISTLRIKTKTFFGRTLVPTTFSRVLNQYS